MISSVSRICNGQTAEFSLLKHDDTAVDLLMYYGPRDESPDYYAESEHILAADISIRENFIKIPKFHTFDDETVDLLYDGWGIYHVGSDNGHPPIYIIIRDTNGKTNLEIDDDVQIWHEYTLKTNINPTIMKIPIEMAGDLFREIHREMIRGCPADDV